MSPLPATRAAVRRSILAVAAIAAIVLLPVGSVQAETLTVASLNFRFEPETRTAAVGDVVRWTFAGDPHTVTSGAPGAKDGRFDSGIKNPGDTYQLALTSPGTFPYFCEIHPEQMFGTLVVTGGPAATPKPTAKPTTRPTARPTAPPTARPTARPTAAPTARPTSAPTEAPTTAPTPAPTQSATPSPAPSDDATPSPSATTTAIPSASNLIGEASPSAGPSAAPEPNSAGAVDPAPLVAAAIVVVALVGGGLALARRSGRV